jgi:hypothetical protein
VCRLLCLSSTRGPMVVVGTRDLRENDKARVRRSSETWQSSAHHSWAIRFRATRPVLSVGTCVHGNGGSAWPCSVRPSALLAQWLVCG